MHRAAHGHQRGFGLEHVELVLAHREAHGAGAAVAVHQRADDENALEDLAHAALQQGVLGGFRHDDLVGLAVDHELPAAFMNVLALLVFPDRQAPLLEQVHGGVHVAGDVGHQVFAGDAHQVVAHVVHVVLDGVVAVLQAHVLVDGRKAHGHGAGTVHGGLVHQRDLQAVLLGPVGRFDSRAAGGHAAAQNQQIGFDGNSFKIRPLHRLLSFFRREDVGQSRATPAR